MKELLIFFKRKKKKVNIKILITPSYFLKKKKKKKKKKVIIDIINKINNIYIYIILKIKKNIKEKLFIYKNYNN